MIGRLSIGFVPTAIYEILPTILSTFRASQPLVDLGLYEMNTADQAEPPLQRRIDVSLTRPPTSFSQSIVQETLVRERAGVALPGDHQRRGRAPVAAGAPPE